LQKLEHRSFRKALINYVFVKKEKKTELRLFL